MTVFQDIGASRRRYSAYRPYARQAIKPATLWLQRGAFIAMVAAAIGLIIFGRNETLLVSRLREAMADAVAPMLDLVAWPVRKVEEVVEGARDIANLQEEIARLRAEAETLREWQRIAAQLQAENDALRRLARFPQDAQLNYLTVRVVGDFGGAFIRHVLVGTGIQGGVKVDQAAVTGDGLIGRVREVGLHSARVVLLTDAASRVPVVLERTRDRAILVGDNSNRPRLTYLQPDADPQVGDHIVTSGNGGIFPAGLPVGVIEKMGDSGPVVRLFADVDKLEYLRLVDFDIPAAPPGIELPSR